MAAPAKPQSGQSTSMTANFCKRAETLIDGDVMDISDATADETSETSAPRAAVAEQKIAAAYLEIQVNVLLMDQHHCAPYQHPINGSDYLIPATKCKADRLQAIMAHSANSPESCDRTKWVRMEDFGKAESPAN